MSQSHGLLVRRFYCDSGSWTKQDFRTSPWFLGNTNTQTKQLIDQSRKWSIDWQIDSSVACVPNVQIQNMNKWLTLCHKLLSNESPLPSSSPTINSDVTELKAKERIGGLERERERRVYDALLPFIFLMFSLSSVSLSLSLSCLPCVSRSTSGSAYACFLLSV